MQQQGPAFEEMLAAVLPLYKALLQAVAALGFLCVRVEFCSSVIYNIDKIYRCIYLFRRSCGAIGSAHPPKFPPPQKKQKTNTPPQITKNQTQGGAAARAGHGDGARAHPPPSHLPAGASCTYIDGYTDTPKVDPYTFHTIIIFIYETNAYKQQVYPDLLRTPANAPVARAASDSDSGRGSKGLGIDLVTYFDEMHESVFRAVTALPFAVCTKAWFAFGHYEGGDFGVCCFSVFVVDNTLVLKSRVKHKN